MQTQVRISWILPNQTEPEKQEIIRPGLDSRALNYLLPESWGAAGQGIGLGGLTLCLCNNSFSPLACYLAVGQDVDLGSLTFLPRCGPLSAS